MQSEEDLLPNIYNQLEDERSGILFKQEKLKKGESVELDSMQLIDKDVVLETAAGDTVGKLIYNYNDNRGYRTFRFVFPNDFEVLLPIPDFNEHADNEKDKYLGYEYVIGKKFFDSCFDASDFISDDHIKITVYSDTSVKIDFIGDGEGLIIDLINKMLEAPFRSRHCIAPDVGEDLDYCGRVANREFSISTTNMLGQGSIKVNNEDSFALNMENDRIVICDGISMSISSEFAASLGARILAKYPGSMGMATKKASEAVELLNHFYEEHYKDFIGNEARGRALLSNAVHGALEFWNQNSINFNSTGDIRLKIIYDGKVQYANHVVNAVSIIMADFGGKMSERDATAMALAGGTYNCVYNSLVGMNEVDLKVSSLRDFFVPDHAIIVMYSDGIDLDDEQLLECVEGKSVDEIRKTILLAQKLMNMGGVKTLTFKDDPRPLEVPAACDNSTLVVIGPAGS
jgi:hypothetical protein